MKGIWFALPPIREQEALLAAIADRTASLRTAGAVARREINLLGEYRTRLIADVVTGKLDVREAAERLPDEVDEMEPEAPDEPESAEEVEEMEDTAEVEG
jgi:hypothetical protein